MLFGRYGYVEMIKYLIINTLFCCRLFTDVPIHSIYGRLYNGWRIETCYGGLCTIEDYGDGYLFPAWMANCSAIPFTKGKTPM
jgi:hypothetical protein